MSSVNTSEHTAYQWFNSYHVPLDVQIGVARLELPMDLKVGSNVPEDLHISAQLVCNQSSTHALSLGTVFAVADEYRNALVWDYVLTFPVKIQSLSVDSILVLTAWTADDKVYGGTTMRLFDENGVLKFGKQKLVFFFDRPGDANPSSKNTTPGDVFYDKFKHADHGFRMEKHLEKYKTTLMSLSRGEGADSLDWLDRLTLAQVQATECIARNRTGSWAPNGYFHKTIAGDSFTHSPENEQEREHERDPFTLSGEDHFPNWGRSPEELDLQVLCCLVVELPVLPHPVLHEERPYHQVSNFHIPMQVHHQTFTNPSQHPCSIKGDKGQAEFSLVKGTSFQGSMLGIIADWDLESDNFPNLAEEQNRKLNISTIRGTSDPNAKPNLEQKAMLDRIVNSSGRKLASADKDLLYRFRYALTENKKALTKVLLSIDWDMESERAEVPTLLSLWKAKAPIDVADALKLLCNEREFQNAMIRQYAVDVLRTASDEELHLFLLQLVQALRYEPALSPLTLLEESEQQVSAADATAATTTTTTTSTTTTTTTTAITGIGSFRSPLAMFLFERAAASESLSLNLYWFLKVETDTQDEDSSMLYCRILQDFLIDLRNNCGPEGKSMAEQLEALDGYLAQISQCQREARKSGSKRWMLGRNDFVETTLNKMLVDGGLQRLPAGFDSLPSPLDPSIRLVSLDKMSKMFKSALYPCVIDFNAKHKAQRRDSINRASLHAAAAVAAAAAAFSHGVGNNSKTAQNEVEGPSFKNRILFKCGDDLRQDQLIMHLFSLMDMLLKKVNLDLKLRTYGILATGQKDGLMEFVESMPISGVESPRQTIFDYLQVHNPDPTDPTKISPECLDTFIKSCAGSCVLTYILGVGDRHHDNIMLTKRGQLFHIDFGFVFGKDPKPMPPPFRLSKGMVDAMGGIESEGFVKFGKNCCQAFNWLRKSANVILNLISLMGDSGIPVIEQMGLDAVLEVVETRLRLNLTDEEAETFFLSLMESTMHAVMPDLIDLFHKLAVQMK